jgi:hypothetical protein
MDAVIREALYVYDVTITDTQSFIYRDRTFRWFVRGSHVTLVRQGTDGTLRLTCWHDMTPLTLWPKINRYLQAVR